MYVYMATGTIKIYGGWPSHPGPHKTLSGTHSSPGGTLRKDSAMGYRCCKRHVAHGLPSAGTNFRSGSAPSEAPSWEAYFDNQPTTYICIHIYIYIYVYVPETTKNNDVQNLQKRAITFTKRL